VKLKNHIGSIAFVVAAAASAVYGVTLEREGKSGVRDGEGARALPSFDRAALTRLELARADERLVLVRDRPGEPFRFERPEPWAVDVASVDELVTALDIATALRSVSDPPTRMTRARGELRFGERVVRFTLGGPAASPEGAAYFSVEGGGTVVVGRELAAQLLRPMDTFRERGLVPYAPLDVARIETRGPSGTLVTTRIDGASFRVVGGARVRRETSDRWLGALPELRASSFLASSAVPSTSPWSVRVVAKDGRATTLRFGGSCPDDKDGVVASVAAEGPGASPTPMVACVARALAAQFDVAPALAVDDRLFFGRSDEISEISLVATSGRELSLARVGSGFHERRPTSRDLDADESDAAAALVARVLDVHGMLVARPLDPVTAAPALKLQAVRVESDVGEALTIFDTPGGSYAHRAADDAWLALSEAARLALEPPSGGIHADALLGPAFAPSAVSKLAIRCGATTQSLVRATGGFAYESPSELPADATRVDELLEALAHARTSAIVPASDATNACVVTLEAGAADGGAPSRTTLTVTFDDGADGGPSRVLVVRAPSRESFALADGRASRALERLLREPLVERGALAWVGAEPVSVTLTQGGKSETLAGGARTRALEIVRALHAERIERLGAALAGEGFSKPALELRLVADGRAPTTYRFVRTAQGGGFLVRRSGLEVSARVRDDDLGGLLGGPAPTE